ncbi:MAG: aromatic ring-hydroxylating dioxygenase subunit alpha, partial [Deltaproteobacteria bacterium]|nr:aromatic ring-hydroxylating dioxygenase subunit alpha [Deltaproteobacteria bacterium]
MTGSIQEIIESYDAKLFLAEASTPPSSWYTDQQILNLEKRTVFTGSWQLAGRADQVRGAGHYVTAEIAGEPLLVIRGKDGVLRGFFNVCRHHAATVMTQPKGKAEYLRCPYHGWTYDLQGALIQPPEFGGVQNFDRAAHGLIPVQASEWQGWVFVRLDAAGPSLQSFLGGNLLDRFELLNLEQFHGFQRRRYSLNCNWKVFVDNYLDGGYHVPHIHADLNTVLDSGKYEIETGQRFC